MTTRKESSPGPRRLGVLLLGGLVLLLAPLPWLGNLRDHLSLYLPLALVSTLLLTGGWWWMGRRGCSPSRRVIIGGAVLLRLLTLPMAPSLSDDLWRYLWDGRLVLHGISPYRYIPADPALAQFHDTLLSLQGYPDTHTVYPPLAQLFFAIGAVPSEVTGSITAGVIGYKLLVVAAEIGTVLLLLALLDRWRIDRRHLLLYAWHPLPIIELVGQGHTDAFWVLAVVGGLAAYAWGRGGAGLASIALGGAARLYPFALLPIWTRFVPSGQRQSRTAAVGRALLWTIPSLLLMLPFLDPEVRTEFLAVVERFTNYFEFNGGVYYAIKWLLDEAHIAPSNRIAGGLCLGIGALFHLIILLLPVRERSPRTLAARALLLLTAQIILGAKAHIWYFCAPLALLPLLPRHPLRWAWLWCATIAPLTYLYYASTPNTESTILLIGEWGGFGLLALLGLFLRHRNETPPTSE